MNTIISSIQNKQLFPNPAFILLKLCNCHVVYPLVQVGATAFAVFILSFDPSAQRHTREWMNERVTEWLNDWMTEWMTESKKCRHGRLFSHTAALPLRKRQRKLAATRSFPPQASRWSPSWKESRWQLCLPALLASFQHKAPRCRVALTDPMRCDTVASPFPFSLFSRWSALPGCVSYRSVQRSLDELARANALSCRSASFCVLLLLCSSFFSPSFGYAFRYWFTWEGGVLFSRVSFLF